MTPPDSGAGDAPPPQPSQRSASPSNSFYAQSDDEEGEYDTITHEATSKGVKLLFSKGKVSSRTIIRHCQSDNNHANDG